MIVDHKDTDFIVCPHCGHVHQDSWEWESKCDCGRDCKGECESCGKKFIWSWHEETTYSYSTRKIVEKSETNKLYLPDRLGHPLLQPTQEKIQDESYRLF
jgi:hypothetical protein